MLLVATALTRAWFTGSPFISFWISRNISRVMPPSLVWALATVRLPTASNEHKSFFI